MDEPGKFITRQLGVAPVAPVRLQVGSQDTNAYGTATAMDSHLPSYSEHFLTLHRDELQKITSVKTFEDSSTRGS